MFWYKPINKFDSDSCGPKFLTIGSGFVAETWRTMEYHYWVIGKVINILQEPPQGVPEFSKQHDIAWFLIFAGFPPRIHPRSPAPGPPLGLGNRTAPGRYQVPPPAGSWETLIKGCLSNHSSISIQNYPWLLSSISIIKNYGNYG